MTIDQYLRMTDLARVHAGAAAANLRPGRINLEAADAELVAARELVAHLKRIDAEEKESGVLPCG